MRHHTKWTVVLAFGLIASCCFLQSILHTTEPLIRASARGLLYKGTQPSAELCPPGSYRAGGISIGECILCPRGYYGANGACDEKCPKGTYNDRLGATSKNDCVQCPAGVYGSSTGLKTRACTAACPLGTYSNTEGLERENQCIDCPPNYRGTQGLRGNDVNGRFSGGHMCDRYWKGKDLLTGRDAYRMTLLYQDV